MDTTTFEKTKDGFLEKTEKISSWDGIGLYLSRDYPNASPKAIMIILHGLANHLSLYDNFVIPFLEQGIAIYRYDARGHGKSEGKRGYLNSYWEMVDDLRVIVSLVKKENPGLPVFVLGHSMGGHVAAL